MIEALRGLPETERPQRLYGCEVWRDLDWLVDADKVAFDLAAHENLHSQAAEGELGVRERCCLVAR